MQGATVDVTTADGVADAYLTWPDDGAPHRGVLFIMDAIGLRPRIQEMADWIAAQGYVVLAPNFFYRGGRAPVVPAGDLKDPRRDRDAFMAQIRPLMGQLTPDALAGDGAAYLEYLAEVAPGPVAITGYCMGARAGWRIAAAHPARVVALGGFHGGGLVTDAPDSPHLSAADLDAELYFGHADQDPNMNPDQIAVLDRALDEAGVTHRTEVYDGALHGYTMSDMPVYDEAATERHFTELFALLQRTLAAA
jgi:carboxymethylenebutenolidase